MNDLSEAPNALAGTREKKAQVWARDALDWYVEEPRASKALFAVERFNGPIWDPCCGQGNILNSAMDAGYTVTGTDMEKRSDSVLITGGVDFLTVTIPRANNIVMNPPFFRAKGTEDFIRHALTLAKGKIAAFVDIKFMAGGNRANGLFREHPPHRVWVVTPRVSCPPGVYLQAGNKAGGGTADWIWMVWDMTAPPAQYAQFGWLRAGGT